MTQHTAILTMADLSNGAVFNVLERLYVSFKVMPFFDAEYLTRSPASAGIANRPLVFATIAAIT